MIGVCDEGFDAAGFEDEVGPDQIGRRERCIGDLCVAEVDAVGAAAAGRAGWVLRGDGAGRGGGRDVAGRRGGCGGGGVTAKEEKWDGGGGAP